MEAAVSDILRSRSHEPGGLKKTSAISLAAHVVVFGIVAFVPGIIPRAAERPRVVMTISLGGAPGPDTGGVQMIGGINVQAAAPSTAPMIPPKIAPLSTTPAKMPLPDKPQKLKTPPKPTVSSNDPKGTLRGRGFETQLGTSRVDTGAKNQGFGLSSGGGGDGGVRLGVENFCCPEYLADMNTRIRKNWNENQQTTGLVTMKFVIQRNGQITEIATDKSSGNAVLDLTSQRALVNTRMLAPLPAAYDQPQLTVYLDFEYARK